MFSVCVNNKIRLEPEWIPRQQNELADYFSCIIVDYDDYMLNPSMFAWIDEIWGPHSINRFASPVNTQLERLNMRFWAPGSEVEHGQQLVVSPCQFNP